MYDEGTRKWNDISEAMGKAGEKTLGRGKNHEHCTPYEQEDSIKIREMRKEWTAKSENMVEETHAEPVAAARQFVEEQL